MVLTRRLVPVAGVVLTGALGACSFAASPDAVAREAIAIAWQEHIDAAKRKDLDSVMRIYADDVIYIVPGFQDLRGNSAVEAMEAETLVSADVLDAKHSTESLRVFDDLAYELGTVIGPVRQKGETAQTVTFHYMATWRRQPDGSWKTQVESVTAS